MRLLHRILPMFGLLTTSSLAQSIPPIQGFNFRGNGCPPNSVQATSQGGRGSFRFNDWVVSVGPGADPMDSMKMCLIQIQFQSIPTGYRMIAEEIEGQAFFELDSGARAVFSTTPFWTGSNDTSRGTYESMYDSSRNGGWGSGSGSGELLNLAPSVGNYRAEVSSCDVRVFSNPDLNVILVINIGGNLSGGSTVHLDQVHIKVGMQRC